MGAFFVHSSANLGLETHLISVEADVQNGLSMFRIVGLPDAAVSESRDRVRAAIKNSGYKFPRTRVTVSLAPADLRKQGPAYDLPVAVSLLGAIGVIEPSIELDKLMFISELALSGELRPVNGVLLAAALAREHNLSLVLAPENANEAALVDGLKVHPIKSLRELAEMLANHQPLPLYRRQKTKRASACYELDMSDVKGQEHAKRALEIAAAGSHNILLTGPPGSGKTMLARAFPTILPNLTGPEAIEVTKIHSVAGVHNREDALVRERPFRAPHHTSSSVAIVGGGTWPKPGEVSLAHRGVLFLDEFPEFPRAAIENLRQPLEDGVITIARAAGTLQFPARFSLIAAMNPCPCGFLSDPDRDCTCSSSQINRYSQRLSGPLLDRIDISIEVPRLDLERLTAVERGESSRTVRARVQRARNRQLSRYADSRLTSNSELRARSLAQHCRLDKHCRDLLRQAAARLYLSARGYTRVLRVARTIADLAGDTNLSATHLAEALQYRVSTTRDAI